METDPLKLRRMGTNQPGSSGGDGTDSKGRLNYHSLGSGGAVSDPLTSMKVLVVV